MKYFKGKGGDVLRVAMNTLIKGISIAKIKL